MVEQNNDNTNNEEVAPKRRGRLFGGRRARSTGQEARGDAAPTGSVEQVTGSRADPATDAAETLPVTEAEPQAGGAPEAAPEVEAPAVSVAVEATAGGDEPHDVSTLTGDLPVIASGDDTETAAAPVVTVEAEASSASSPAEPVDEPFVPKATSTLSLIFHAPVLPELPDRAPRHDEDDDEQAGGRRRSRRRGTSADREGREPREPRDHLEPRRREVEYITEPQRIKGSTRLEAKKQRRRDGRDAGRRRQVVTEDEFLARRESVERQMIVRSSASKIEIGVLEDGILAEHYVTKSHNVSLIGNVYLGKVQNVLPSMEAAFVDIGRGRNAVLYAGEVDWSSVDTGNHGRRIEAALKPGDKVLVQVTKDPVGHKGARLTSQVSLPGRYLVYVPNGSMNGISRKLPDTERARLKKILKEVLPEHAGVIVRTAAEGATEEQLTRDVQRLTSQISLPGRYLVYVPNGSMNGISRKLPDTERARLKKILKEVLPESAGVIVRTAAEGATEEQLTLDVTRLTSQWADISARVESQQAPSLLHSEPDLLIKIIRDVFNEDFQKLVIAGDDARQTIENYLRQVAPDLLDRVEAYTG
ncbi:MAG: ribonuclease E/G, partial [Curtobacterium sp.]